MSPSSNLVARKRSLQMLNVAPIGRSSKSRVLAYLGRQLSKELPANHHHYAWDHNAFAFLGGNDRLIDETAGIRGSCWPELELNLSDD
jgi:hypothetical protein